MKTYIISHILFLVLFGVCISYAPSRPSCNDYPIDDAPFLDQIGME